MTVHSIAREIVDWSKGTQEQMEAEALYRSRVGEKYFEEKGGYIKAVLIDRLEYDLTHLPT